MRAHWIAKDIFVRLYNPALFLYSPLLFRMFRLLVVRQLNSGPYPILSTDNRARVAHVTSDNLIPVNHGLDTRRARKVDVEHLCIEDLVVSLFECDFHCSFEVIRVPKFLHIGWQYASHEPRYVVSEGSMAISHHVQLGLAAIQELGIHDVAILVVVLFDPVYTPCLCPKPGLQNPLRY
jgi:hypothetical protein